MLTPNTQVTIESNSALDGWTGRSAKVVKTVGCFVILDIDGDIHSCIKEGVSPKVTAQSLAARFGYYD